jgi:hypothetical protein
MNSKSLPPAVLDSLRKLLDVCGKHNVPLHALIESPSGQRVREAEEESTRLRAQVEHQRRVIAKLESDLGIDQDL